MRGGPRRWRRRCVVLAGRLIAWLTGAPFGLHYENKIVITKANDHFAAGTSSARKPTKGEAGPGAGEPEAADAERYTGGCE